MHIMNENKSEYYKSSTGIAISNKINETNIF